MTSQLAFFTLISIVLRTRWTAFGFTTCKRSFTYVPHSTILFSVQEPEHQVRNSIESIPTFNSGSHRSLPESQYTQLLTSLSLKSIASKLRLFYDKQFQDPRQPDANRFIWDPWFVTVGDGKQGQPTLSSNEDDDNDDSERQATEKQIQYSLKRIQCSSFFSEEIYDDLLDDLVSLASSIGLTSITPPWLSLYTEGDLQNFHTDSSHGQMAFVLSLCKEGDFDGGETILMRKEILEFWKDFDSSKGIECGSILRFIPATPLGKCIAFDPRIPHGVNRVTGTQDPRRGRLIIHGWFAEPENCWFGPWEDVKKEETKLESKLNAVVEALGGGNVGRIIGMISVKLEVDQDGFVNHLVTVCDTLQADWNDFNGIIGYDENDRPIFEDSVSDVRLTIHEALSNLQFEPITEIDESRSIVIPFVFE